MIFKPVQTQKIEKGLPQNWVEFSILNIFIPFVQEQILNQSSVHFSSKVSVQKVTNANSLMILLLKEKQKNDPCIVI